MVNKYQILEVVVTFPDEISGKICANTLLKEQLIACCNISGCTSMYKWEGEQIEENEVILKMKSSMEIRSELEKRIIELHSYNVPAIVFNIIETTSSYYGWIKDCVKQIE